jgi:ATP-dependent DNA helicase PIF1
MTAPEETAAKRQCTDSLTSEQRAAYDLVIAGRNCVITGRAGCGKSHWVRAVSQPLSYERGNLFVTGMTGIAALQAGGVTLHKFLGIGIADKPIDQVVRGIRTRYKRTLQRLQQLRVLIVDEVSMMSAHLFEYCDRFLRIIRNDNRVWGGVQLIFVGDMRQLQPVAPNKAADHPEANYFFQSTLFEDTFIHNQGGVHQFTHNFRQGDDPVFQQLLDRAGEGTLTEADHVLLRGRLTRVIGPPPTDSTRLYGTNNAVSRYNTEKLQQLEGDVHVYDAVITTKQNLGGSEAQIAKLKEFMYKNILAEAHLELKLGAYVMILKNIDPDNKVVNGTCGKIIDFQEDGTPLFQADESKFTMPLTPVEWEVTEPDVATLVFSQLPVKVAYSVTVHKAQGQTLPRVTACINRANIFAAGQAYVIFSRCTSLEGLYLEEYNEQYIRADPVALEFYKKYT